jgi:N-methylhydantoinase B
LAKTDIQRLSVATEGDGFDFEISRSYLASAVREMRLSTARSAYSTCFAEGEDFTCGILDAEGKLVAQAGLPGHMGTLVDSMRAVREALDTFEAGDIVLHNDPFDRGSHQGDVLMARPLFFEDELIGFAVNRGHWIDVGGAAAGGWDGSTTHAVEEGLVIPPTKLYERGHLRRDVRDFILKNVRMPRYVWGDLQAQVASSVVAERRIGELIASKGVEHVRTVFVRSLAYSRRHFLAHLADMPKGVAAAEDFMEDDGRGGGPYPVRVRVEVSETGVVVDFEGTAPQVMAPINTTLVNAKAATYAAVIAVIDPEVPVSSGCLDLIEVKVPEGTLMNATWPAPIYAGTADPNNRACETVLRALSKISPERVVAGSYATGNNSVGFGADDEGEDFLWYVFESGGLGARANRDGNSAEWHLLPNCKNESMEIWEARFPVRFESYGLRPDSGGAGTKRGGLGTERRIRILKETSVHAVADRHRLPPFGIEGGSQGTCNEFRIETDGVEYRPSELGALSDSKFGRLHLPPGAVFVVRQGGGGGFGGPGQRTFDEIDADLRLGYVSPEGAERDYDVLVDRAPVPPRVDREATRSRRYPGGLDDWRR